MLCLYVLPIIVACWIDPAWGIETSVSRTWALPKIILDVCLLAHSGINYLSISVAIFKICDAFRQSCVCSNVNARRGCLRLCVSTAGLWPVFMFVAKVTSSRELGSWPPAAAGRNPRQQNWCTVTALMFCLAILAGKINETLVQTAVLGSKHWIAFVQRAPGRQQAYMLTTASWLDRLLPAFLSIVMSKQHRPSNTSSRALVSCSRSLAIDLVSYRWIKPRLLPVTSCRLDFAPHSTYLQGIHVWMYGDYTAPVLASMTHGNSRDLLAYAKWRSTAADQSLTLFGNE